MQKSFTLLLFSLSLLLGGRLYGQTARATVVYDVAGESRVQGQVPLQVAGEFMAFSADWRGEAEQLIVRFSEDGSSWGQWAALGLYAHASPRSQQRISELHFAPANSRYYQLRVPGGAEALTLHFFDPGRSRVGEARPSPALQRSPAYCPCPLGDFEDREDWCPSGTCPEDATPVNTSVTHLIVHHSAGTNTASDWAAVVRAIWDFHVFVNGWDDIGYNWLIDPDGELYQGRGDNKIGAHFCSTNSGTMGVCVLGDFTDITATEEAKTALTRLLAWKSCDVNQDPLLSSFHPSSNLNLMHISGHRDGCATSCPGDSFYPELDDIRQAVVGRIANNCAAIAPPAELAAALTNDTTVLLQWTDASDNEEAFLLERALSEEGAYAQIAELPANTVSYEDEGVDPETGYYYRVRAYTGQDTSFYSNIAFVFTSVVSTKDELLGTPVHLFPNPAAEEAWLKWETPLPGPLQLRLSNAQGQPVKNWNTEGAPQAFRLDLSGLPSGLYTLEIQASGQRSVKKLLKN